MSRAVFDLNDLYEEVNDLISLQCQRGNIQGFLSNNQIGPIPPTRNASIVQNVPFENDLPAQSSSHTVSNVQDSFHQSVRCKVIQPANVFQKVKVASSETAVMCCQIRSRQ